jgi:hypothetical protein
MGVWQWGQIAWLISLPQFVHLGMAEQSFYCKEVKH